MQIELVMNLEAEISVCKVSFFITKALLKLLEDSDRTNAKNTHQLPFDLTSETFQ